MQSAKQNMVVDAPTFLTELRGGWDEWSTERSVLVEVASPSGDSLQTNDELTVDADAAPESVGVGENTGDVTVTIEMGSWVDNGREVVIEADTTPWFSVRLDETEFRAAWGEWLKP